MFLPHPVIEQLSDEQVAMWNRHFVGDGHERPRSVEEGIWRRTQDPANAEQSGWTEDASGRRRVVHYRNDYTLDYTHPVPRLVLAEMYLYVSYTAPTEEISAYAKSVQEWLGEGRWKPRQPGIWQRRDLAVSVCEFDVHPQDERADRATPAGFRSLDVLFTSEGYSSPARTLRNLPWDVLAGGIRVKEQRGNPAIAEDLAGILDFLPFQVEVGCGTSIEAGIPPLHYLHEVYRVTARKDNALTQAHAFTLSPQADTLVQELLLDAPAKARDLTRMFAACFVAQPTSAHRALKALHDAGHMIGPVITHNFDVLSARAGLPEVFVRRYDQKIPPVPLLDEARSLLVIGLHADRRAVQARARAKGMKIFYMDPEGLVENNVFKEYPIEGARDGDTVVRASAIPALGRLCELLNVTA
ncbi:hypothetical protein [Streptantibioticus ferralitis]|uniref:Deacetylase sirtuin-type domain-containing protein n=1 Tax=Streptantibioticus ferralitis TaxID=236510 RepID=A0ABT5Z771_9ACTN|nr:hypothetical protein [Streptantibioticus ferralitis]MDF2259687.1 hypothetical protein [Streptantibioticus ferralitis]